MRPDLDIPAAGIAEAGPDPSTSIASVAAELDITADLCPMTFVRTRIALDRLPPGALLRVRLRGDEPRRNVPRTAQQQGHEVVGLADGPDGTVLLLLRKGTRQR